MTTTEHQDHRPNHHAHHHGFSGVTGLVVGLTMTVGRTADARLAAELVGLEPDDRVVDVGCGPGSAARYAAGRVATVTGIDPATVMLNLARRLTRKDRVSYLEGRAEALPLPDASATVLWTLASVHHWPDVEAGLAEAQRVLAPGGRFLAIERRTRSGATGLASHGWTDQQAEAFAEQCRRAGFTDVEVAHHEGRRRLVSVLGRRGFPRSVAGCPDDD